MFSNQRTIHNPFFVNTSDMVSAPLEPENRNQILNSLPLNRQNDTRIYHSPSCYTVPQGSSQVSPHNSVSLAPLIGISTHHFGSVTNFFNDELTDYLIQFSKMDKSSGTRQTAVTKAWKYEQAEVQMGGKGTGNFTSQQRQELLETGRVRGAEGHHINNVADHPELQGNPDNIKMVRDRAAHLEEHHGDFKNETSGALIDRDGRLIDTNNRRVFRNELSGIGVAAAIGLGSAFSINFIINLAQNGLNPNSLKYAFISSAKAGCEGALLSSGSALFGRTIGSELSVLVENAIYTHIGLSSNRLIANVSIMSNMAIVGAFTVLVVAIYQFTKLRLLGYSTKECLIRVSNSSLLSLSVLVLSIVAQGIWGGPAGIVVSVTAGIIITGYTILNIARDCEMSKKITYYTVQLCYPSY